MPGKGKAEELTANEAAFCLEYEANGRNATRAYMAVHPKAKPTTAAVEGLRTLRKPKVEATLEGLRALRAKHLTMTADEAAMLVGISARSDIRNAYDAEGKLLPVHQWPDEVAKAVKTVREDGTPVFHDQLKARQTVLLMQGKLKQVVDVNHFDHVGYLAQKNQEHKGHATSEQGAAAGAAAHDRRASRRPGKGGRVDRVEDSAGARPVSRAVGSGRAART